VTQPEARSADRILLKALELFSNKGYEASSVREICEASGLTKPTLYHFYGSKEGVYRAIVDGALEGFHATLAKDLAEPGTSREQLKRMGRRYFDYAGQNQQLMRFIFSTVHNPSSAAPRTDFPRFYQQVLALVGTAIEAGVTKGELRPGPIDVRLLTLMGALGESLCGYLMTGEPQLTSELADALVDSLFEGWAAHA
jgi:AcrR family transcriptional regulator